MVLHVLMSPGGSPGVTTTALATTYGWGGPVLLAECDPHGGSVLRGYLAGGMVLGGTGLLNLSSALARSLDPAILWDHVISLDGDRRWLLLPGLTDPREAPQLADQWDAIAKVLAAQDIDVVADIGRVGDPQGVKALLESADRLLMLLLPTFRQVAAAQDRLDAIARHIRTPVELGLVGTGDYRADEIDPALGSRPVIAHLPYDREVAAVLSDGQQTGQRRLERSPLLRTAAALAAVLQGRRPGPGAQA